MTSLIEPREWQDRMVRPCAPVPTLDDQLARLFRCFRGAPAHLVELADHLEQTYPAAAAVTRR